MRYSQIIEADWGTVKRSRTLHRQDVAWIFYTLNKLRDHQRLHIWGSITRKSPDGEWFPIGDVDAAYLMEEFAYREDTLPRDVRSDLYHLRSITERYRDQFDFFLVCKDGLWVKTDAGGVGFAQVQDEPIAAIRRTGVPLDTFVATFQPKYFPEGFSDAIGRR